jgi:hypothetical protein
MRLGTALALVLLSSKAVESDADPWPVIDALLRGKKPPQRPYVADLEAVRETWANIADARRAPFSASAYAGPGAALVR